jgi:subtilase family serine protease
MLCLRCVSWSKELLRSCLFGRCRPIRSRVARIFAPVVELLETRVLPSISLNFVEFHDPSRIPAGRQPSALGILPQDNGFQFPIGYEPSDIRTAYGIDRVMFGSVAGDGTGQTIAIVDAYDDPAFLNSTDSKFATSDLAQFDVALGIADPPSFLKVNQSGQTSPLPGTDPAGAGNANGNWEIEEALDIEWAHGIAPGANIILVEANTANDDDLYAAVATAAALPGVSAVSMSWGENEASSQLARDSTFVTPSGHQGVTFLAASGDTGGFAVDNNGNPTTTPGIDYPAASPNVVAVGGTSLQLNSDSTYSSETAWSGSGGGTSQYEKVPGWQLGVQTTGWRTTPDVAFDADPYTGVAIYDSYNNRDNSGPWVQIGGTSLAAPAWAGLIAIANQGRVLAGGSTLDGPGQTLPALYSFAPTDFNDITTGSNGVFNAGPGYDEVTGLGSPIAPAVVGDLSTYGSANRIAFTAQPPSSVIVGDHFGVVVAAMNDVGGVDPAFNGTLTIALASGPAGANLGGTLTATAVNGVAVFDGLSLDTLGTGYTLQVTSDTFPAITTNAFAVIADPTPWQGTFYPVPTDASLRAAISAADSNGFAFNTILLSASTYRLTDKSAGGIVIANTSALPEKTLTITGQGPTSSVISSTFLWHSRIFEIDGSGGQSLNVAMQDLTIQGGAAGDGGALGGSNALGGGLLINNANVTLTNDVVQKNQAQAARGAARAPSRRRR